MNKVFSGILSAVQTIKEDEVKSWLGGVGGCWLQR